MSSDLSRKKDENPYKHIRQKTNDDWFMYWLCEDKEFINDQIKINEYWFKRYGNPQVKVPEDEAKKIDAMIEKLLKKYGITEDEYTDIVFGLHLQTSFDFPFRVIKREDNGDMVVQIPKDIKRSEYLSAWPEIKDWFEPETNPPTTKQKVDRVRSADDTQLIYAVFKARRRGATFKEIFDQYQKGELDQYSDKARNQFSSEDSLERYYNKYKPDR